MILLIVLLVKPTGLFLEKRFSLKAEASGTGTMNMPSDDAKKRQERNLTLFGVLAVLFVFVGMAQSWNVSLAILVLISAIMTLGVNIQWGYAGIVNFGVMGFAALGEGLAGVVVSMPPVIAGWQAGGIELLLGGLIILITIVLAVFIASHTQHLGRWRFWLIAGVSLCGYFLAADAG